MARNNIMTPEGVGTYVNLFVPRARTDAKGNPKGDPKYQMTLVFHKKTDLDDLEEAAKAAGVAKFGPKFMDLVNKGKINWPFTDNDEKAEDDDGNPRKPFCDFKGGVHVGFKTGDRPGIVDENADPILDKSEVYSGMLARVSCRAFAYDNESKGVAFALVNVQKLGDGERLSGNPSAEDEFKPVKASKPAAKKSRRNDDDDDLLG